MTNISPMYQSNRRCLRLIREEKAPARIRSLMEFHGSLESWCVGKDYELTNKLYHAISNKIDFYYLLLFQGLYFVAVRIAYVYFGKAADKKAAIKSYVTVGHSLLLNIYNIT